MCHGGHMPLMHVGRNRLFNLSPLKRGSKDMGGGGVSRSPLANLPGHCSYLIGNGSSDFVLGLRGRNCQSQSPKLRRELVYRTEKGSLVVLSGTLRCRTATIWPAPPNPSELSVAPLENPSLYLHFNSFRAEVFGAQRLSRKHGV